MSKDPIKKREISEVDKRIENDIEKIERERKEGKYGMTPCACQNFRQYLVY